MARRLTEARARAREPLAFTRDYRETIETYLRRSRTATAASRRRRSATTARRERDALEQALDATTRRASSSAIRTSSARAGRRASSRELAHAHGALLVTASAEPYALALVESPGALGADIAVGEGQPLGLPAAVRRPRRRPLRVPRRPGVPAAASRAASVGETVDKNGERGYVLTLSTREQHIRRERATSNICTNQGSVALRSPSACACSASAASSRPASSASPKASTCEQILALSGLLGRVRGGADLQRVRRARARRQRRGVVEALEAKSIIAGSIWAAWIARARTVSSSP